MCFVWVKGGGRKVFEGVWAAFLLPLLTEEFWLCLWLVFCMLSLNYQHLLLTEKLQCSLLGKTLVWRNLLADMRFPIGLENGWKEAVTAPQHDTSGRALSEGMFTRYFAGCFCPGFKLIPVWRLFNCANVQLSLSLMPCPQQGRWPQAWSCTFGHCVCWDPSMCSENLGRVTLHPGTGSEKVISAPLSCE